MVGEIQDVDLKLIVEHIEKISANFAKDPSIVSAREAFTNGLKDYEVTDDIKALRYAEFEMSMATLTFSKSVELASNYKGIEQSVAVSKNEALLKQIQRLEVEVRTLKHLGVKIAIASDGKDIKEDKKTGLVDEQIKTEKYRHNDFKASINIKNQSAVATFQQAKFEEARKEIAIKSNQDNMFLKKADFRVMEMDAYAKDDDITISATQMSGVKTTIDAISTNKLSYTSTVTNRPEKISTTI